MHGAVLVLQHELEVRLQASVLAEQVVEVAVEEAVAPDQLEQHVEEEPGVLDVFHAVGGLQQFVQRLFIAAEQRVDQLVLRLSLIHISEPTRPY